MTESCTDVEKLYQYLAQRKSDRNRPCVMENIKEKVIRTQFPPEK